MSTDDLRDVQPARRLWSWSFLAKVAVTVCLVVAVAVATREADPQDKADSFRNDVVATTVDPPTYEIGQIDIPAIGVSETVFEGDSQTALALGPGHHTVSAQFGQPGNVVIGGHRTTHTHPFLDLDQLKPGDKISSGTPLEATCTK
jgi:sortase (surface protein transpeptidase)